MTDERYELLYRDFEEEFYCTVGYVIDHETGWTDDFCPTSYVDKYITKLNQQNRIIKALTERNKNQKTRLEQCIKLLQEYEYYCHNINKVELDHKDKKDLETISKQTRKLLHKIGEKEMRI